MRDSVHNIQITVVPTAVLDVVWPAAKEILKKAVDASYGVYDVESIYQSLLNGEFALWLVMDNGTPIAALTTRICAYPQGRGLAMDWLAGERMREWLPMVQNIMERYAHDNGCTHLECYGRKAWGRWLQKYGWKPSYIAYKMELTDE